MKHYSKYFFNFLLTTAALIDASNNFGSSPTFVGRSQSLDNARKVAGSVGHTHLYNTDSWYNTFDITFEYDQSFRNSRIAQVLFNGSLQNNLSNTAVTNNTVANNGSCNTDCNTDCNSNCGNTILVQGSLVSGRNSAAWLADYFYLPSSYNGAFSVSPKVKEFIVNFDYFAGLDQLCCGGTYLRIYAPFVHSRWDLGFCEFSNISTSTVGYETGYFGPIAVPTTNLLSSFAEYASGFTPAANALGSSANTQLGTGIVTDPLLFGKFNKCSRSKNGLADLRVELGWNFWQDECYHLGVNFQIAAPTGTKRRAEYLFDPVIGNGKHWELGGGFTGHYLAWSNEDDTRHAGFYMDGTITHLFKHREQRTFDLKGKPNSRYMLAEKFGPNVVGISTGSQAALSQFANEFAPVANLTTFDIKVSTGVQADIALWFNYTACNWSWDLGYDFYGRSREKFECPESNVCETGCTPSTICSPSNRNVWALKGDARVYGFLASNGTPVPLSATESKATICSGTNRNAGLCNSITISTDPYHNNCGIDNPQLAQSSRLANALLTAPGATGSFVNTSIQPLFIQCSDVDFARTRSISNKIFTHVNYTWDCECWIPYLGIGGFAEFGKNGSCNDNCNPSDGCSSPVTCSTDCNGSSVDTTFSKWGIWLKAGVDL